jgi:ribokinase
MKKKIIVVGSIAMDLVVSTDAIPKQGETLFGQSFAMQAGGKGANQAVAAARLTKADIVMLGAVGADSFGQILIENLTSQGIFVENVGTVSQPTGIAQITLFEQDNRIIVVPGANNQVQLKDYDLFAGADLVILQNEIPHAVNLEIAKYCKSKKIKLLYNPAPARATDLEMVDYVDFITPNEHEVKKLFPSLSLEAALRRYPNKLIVTQGAKGVSFFSDEASGLQQVPALKTQAVDTTGAGDTFNGAFAVAISQGLEIEEAIKFAVIASHLSVQKFGAQGGMPSLEEVKENSNYEEKWNIE